MATATTETAQTSKPDTKPGGDFHGLKPDRLLELLGDMMLIRRFEEQTMKAYQQAKIGGFCHIYIGQEATAVGSIAATNNDDPIVTAYRDHGHALARGMDPKFCMAEMYGKITGCAKGKGGSMHLFDKPNQMYGGHAIVGGQCPLGAGLGWAIQYNNEDKVAYCYLGDGALNQGAFHEAMNLVAIYNLPTIFILENNGYSMGTDIARGTAMAHELQVKAESYGMRYAECDGQDLLDTYRVFKEQVDKTRGARPINYNEKSGKREEIPTYSREGRTPGPAFINVKTYRYQGHSMSDPQKYRTKDEVGEKREIDCINRLVNQLIEADIATQEQVDELDQRAKTLSKEAVEFAEESPEIGMDELYTDVYANPFGPYKVGEVHPAFRADPNAQGG